MTKKAEAIYNKYCDKLELALYMYSNHNYTFAELQKEFGYLEKQFKEMVSGMYHYNLLSEKDYDELFTLGFTTPCNMMNKLLGIAQVL